MIQHWAFARGGAWRNPKPTGVPYVCEQCRLDARSGHDGTLTLQAITTIELAPTGHCQSKIADLSYSTEDRELGRSELTPLGKCSGAVELEMVP